jgi:hypothetical protein
MTCIVPGNLHAVNSVPKAVFTFAKFVSRLPTCLGHPMFVDMSLNIVGHLGRRDKK